MTTTAVAPDLSPTYDEAGAAEGHERIEIRTDAGTGLRLIVAVHSTALGPALGGLRLRRYEGGLREALDDVMALSSTMTLKAAAAGLHLGGGKAVILDDGRMDPGSSTRVARLEAAGRVIEELGGAYVTAEDVGTSTEDMEAIARHTRYVVGRAASCGGLGDPSPVTAETVFRAIRVGLAHADGACGDGERPTNGSPANGSPANGSPANGSPANGSPANGSPANGSPRAPSTGLSGRRVGIVGLGKVGSVLADLLLDAGADVLAFDVVPDRLARARARELDVAPSSAAVVGAELDVLAPCALGGLIGERTSAEVRCRVVCGAANNPLSGERTAALLAERGVLYVPDFLANCGGLVHVAAEWEGRGSAGLAVALERAERCVERTLTEAAAGGVTPLEAARRIARERIAAAVPSPSAPAASPRHAAAPPPAPLHAA